MDMQKTTMHKLDRRYYLANSSKGKTTRPNSAAWESPSGGGAEALEQTLGWGEPSPHSSGADSTAYARIAYSVEGRANRAKTNKT